MEANEIYKVILDQREEIPFLVEDNYLTSLIEASNKTGCKNPTLVACSDSRKEVIDDVEVNVVSAYEWLLDKCKRL